MRRGTGDAPFGTQGPATRLLALMCAWCRLVRDEKGGWRAPGARDEGSARDAFTHGICPRCFRREAAAIGRAG